MFRAFEGITGQDQAVEYLQSALDAGRTTHAYLICGGAGSGKEEIAKRFSAALLSNGDEEQFRLACEHPHPDLHLLEPAGVSYLVGQIREVVHDAELAPIRAPRKVYVIAAADRMGTQSANAFLKTLEEPPADVVCILLAQAESAVLETLRSRCEVIALNEVARQAAADPVVFGVLEAISSGCGNRVLLDGAKRLVEVSKRGLEDLEQEQERQLDEQSDYLTQGARKELEKQNKREVSAQQRQELLGIVAQVRGWLRDCLVTQAGTPELISYTEQERQTMTVATTVDAKALLDAIAAADAAADRISYNVTPQLAFEAMLIEIREALCRQ